MNATPQTPNQTSDYFTAPMFDGEVIALAQLLVRAHNAITPQKCSVYGYNMDRALCRDTFAALFIYPNCYRQLCEIRTHFKD